MGVAHRDNTLARWAADLQNDFRARLDWCVKASREANHAPRAVVNGVEGEEILHITARPGQEVSLDAGLSRTPTAISSPMNGLFITKPARTEAKHP